MNVDTGCVFGGRLTARNRAAAGAAVARLVVADLGEGGPQH